MNERRLAVFDELLTAADGVLCWFSKWPTFIPSKEHPDYEGDNGPEAAILQLAVAAAKAKGGFPDVH